MLDAVIRLSLQYRPLVVVIALALLIYGSYLGTQMPIDVFPDLDRPRVILIAECHGLATEEVETLVTQPIEVALLGASGVQDVRSQSTSGLAVIYVEFGWSTEIRAARQTVQERLSVLEGLLPEGIRPIMTPPSSIMGQIMIAGISRQVGPTGGTIVPIGTTSLLAERTVDETGQLHLALWDSRGKRNVNDWQSIDAKNVRWEDEQDPQFATPRDPSRKVRFQWNDTKTNKERFEEIEFPTSEQQQMALRTIADWIVRPRLLKMAGVAEVFTQGGKRKQYQVLVDPTALLEYKVSLQEVEEALTSSNVNTSGGFAVTGESERPIRIVGRLGPDSREVIEDLRKIPVHDSEKRPVLLGQVARVTEGGEFQRGDGSINGLPGVVFTIAKQPHVDTRRLTLDLERAFREVESALPVTMRVDANLFQLKSFIDRGIFNVAEALVIGAVLVLIVLFLFLLNFRTTFITLTAIPLSLVITTLVFRSVSWILGTDLSINVMTLGGIAVAMGELVDDAIVDVENIFRRLKENHLQSQPRPVLEVVYEASREIRGAIVFGTAVVILVFLPLFALTGVEGRLFAPLGVAYIVSILASLLVSLTLTPVLSYYLLPNSKAAHSDHDGWLLQQLKKLVSYLVRLSMAAPRFLLVLTWLGVAIAGWQFSRMGRNFLPQFDEGSVQINVSLPPGSSLSASNTVANAIDEILRSRRVATEDRPAEVLQFVRRTGRAEMDEHAMPVSSSEYIVGINPESGRNREEVLRELLRDLREVAPGVDIEVEQPLAHLISHMVSGVFAQIAVKIHGEDLITLQRLADEAKRALEPIDGLTPPVIEPIQQTPEIHIRLRPDDLAYYGMTRASVAKTVQTALQGEVVTEVLEGQRRFDLLLRLEESYRTDYANLGRLRIDLPNSHKQIELREVADIDEAMGPNSVNHENSRRRVVIRCNTQGRDLASAASEIETTLDRKLDLPEGYFLELGGQFETQQRATRLILLLAALSVLGMFVILLILFPSVRIVLQILNALPTAFIGGVLALVMTHQDLTVASLVGFISLGGIAVRNGILLVTHYEHLMKSEGESFSQQMILRGSLERLAPVLMTALTAGIGLIPLVVGGQAPGREILYPVATVILGGLITSTFCEFLIHPGIYWRFSGRRG